MYNKSNEAFGKKPIVDLLSKIIPETLCSAQHMLNQSSSSGNVIEKSITCAKLSSSQNSNSQPQCQQPFTNSLDIPSSSRSPTTSANDIPIVGNNNRGSDFSCSETKPNQDNLEHLPPFSTSNVKEEISIDDDVEHLLPFSTADVKEEFIIHDDVEHLPPFNTADVKEEIIIDDDNIVTKEEYSYEGVCNEFPEESYDFDTGNQDVKPSTSQQYTVPENVLPETQVGELNRVEGVMRSYQSEVCSKKFQKLSQLKHNMLIHAGLKDFKCDVCFEAFRLPCRIHTGEKPYSCLTCGLSTSTEEAVLPDLPPHTSVLQILRAHRIRRYNVNHPGATTNHEESLRSQRNADPQLGVEVRAPRQVRKKETPGAKQFACVICHNIFSHKISLTRHMLIHTGEKPYKCEICSKKFRERWIRKQHIRIHTGEKPYKCDVCDKSFRQLIQLSVHKRIHTGEKPYKCDVCDESFRQVTQLSVHKRIHTGEKPYVCEVCGSAFRHLKTLNYHTRVHSR